MRRELLLGALGGLLFIPRAKADIQFAAARTRVVATAGSNSVTGSVSETNLGVLRIPAGSMGPNGAFELKALFSNTSNSNNKTIITRFTATSGTVGGGTGNIVGANTVVTTTVGTQLMAIIRNNNATNSQIGGGSGLTVPFFNSATANITYSLDTTADTFINLNGTLAVGTDTLTLVHAYVTIFHS